MKPNKTFTYCEFCNASHEEVSPPSKEQYENGMIKIGENSSILLPIAIVKQNRKKRIADSHAKDLEGLYCNYKCLIGKIKKILTVNKSKSAARSQ